MTRIAINGLGRIGRTFLKLALEHPALEVVAANDIADPNSLVYLLKYDSVYGDIRGPLKPAAPRGTSRFVWATTAFGS
jgi:glyceraldehyde-3-phosphate dehydrogenase/erythrose-4-phosphate dehydrogenase